MTKRILIRYLDTNLKNDLDTICGTFDFIHADARQNLNNIKNFAYLNLKEKHKGFIIVNEPLREKGKIISYYIKPAFKHLKFSKMFKENYNIRRVF